MLKTGIQLAQACRQVAQDHKTLYVLGCIGAPLTENNKNRYLQAQAYNRRSARKQKIQAAHSQTFGFDCVCLVKSLLWGWKGDLGHHYGGAVYASNGVPDVNADAMIGLCRQVSKDFSQLQVGELLWIKGHVGIYIGQGLAVECTPKWADGVQITAVHNLGKQAGINGRSWTKHGKLPWLSYDQPTALAPAASRTRDLAGSYRVSATQGLRLRSGPATTYEILETMPQGSLVRCYGYHTGKWLAVVSPQGQQGYCSADYLVKSHE